MAAARQEEMPRDPPEALVHPPLQLPNPYLVGTEFDSLEAARHARVDGCQGPVIQGPAGPEAPLYRVYRALSGSGSMPPERALLRRRSRRRIRAQRGHAGAGKGQIRSRFSSPVIETRAEPQSHGDSRHRESLLRLGGP